MKFLGKRLLVITAHPDDEGLAGGTMYANHKAGGTSFLICATYGEKGKSHLTKPLSDTALKKVREAELLAAAKLLHIDGIFFLGLPDAAVKANYTKLLKKITAVAKQVRPDYILSFGPDGISGHWDHITVGRAARRVAKAAKIPMIAFTLSSEAITSLRKRFLLVRRKFGSYAGKDVPEHPKADIKIRIDAPVKRRAMREHVSQFGNRAPFSNFPKRIRNKLMGYEYFVKEK